MVRQRPRKSFEEVYGKIDGSKSPSVNNKGIKGVSPNARDQGYLISSNTPYLTTPTPAPPSSVNNSTVNSSRRKTARPYGRPATGCAHKYPSNEEKGDDIKDSNFLKAKTSRGAITTGTNQYNHHTSRAYNEPNKDLLKTGDATHQNPQQYQHHHQNNHQQNNYHHHHPHHRLDEDKDDDTEEFFQLIRQTVENAIGKTISDLLNRNFRELSSKVDRFSLELKNTNEMLHKVQMDLNNKIVHYGEENSRHFRYLCMKSEYDKMFYQHQSMMTAAVVPSKIPNTVEKRTNVSKTNASNGSKTNSNGSDNCNEPCSCRSVISKPQNPSCPAAKNCQKSSSDEQNDVSQKSSEMAMREVLNQIQRFCAQMQMKDVKKGLPASCPTAACDIGGAGDILAGYRHEKAIRINRELFEDDEEDGDFDQSSDSMTPRSDDNMSPHQYGGLTVRTTSATRTQHAGGGGDA